MARAKYRIHEYTELHGDAPPTKSYRYALVGANGEAMNYSEPYTRPEDAERGAKDAKKASRFAKIERAF